MFSKKTADPRWPFRLLSALLDAFSKLEMFSKKNGDRRWPFRLSGALLGAQLLFTCILLIVSTNTLSVYRYISDLGLHWIIGQTSIVIFVTLIHLGCLISSELSPGWNLSFHLVLSLAWITVGALFYYTCKSLDYTYGIGGSFSSGGEFINESSCKAMLGLIFTCGIMSIAIFILSCIVVHRYRLSQRVWAIPPGVQCVQLAGNCPSQPPPAQAQPYNKSMIDEIYGYYKSNPEQNIPSISKRHGSPPPAAYLSQSSH